MNKLEAQSKGLWKLKDDLKKHVTTSELREMLESNDQDSTGSELDLRDRWYSLAIKPCLVLFLQLIVLERVVLDFPFLCTTYDNGASILW